MIRWLNPFVCATAAVMTVVVAASFATLGFGEEAIRLVLRESARVSFTLFLGVLLAPLATLAPSRPTLWLARHRRSLGLSFALAHGVFGTMIVLFVTRFYRGFLADTYVVQRIAGTLGFCAIVFMVATSFAPLKRRLTPRQWRIGHWIGLYTIAGNYLVSFSRRAVFLHQSFYTPFLALLLVAFAVRAAAFVKERSPLSRGQHERVGQPTVRQP